MKLRYGRLVILERAGKDRHKHPLFKCRCDCGNEKIILGGSLKNGRTQSCGCLNRELCAKRELIHGHSKRGHRTSTYKIWAGMHSRCSLPSATGWKYYGARGVRVCDWWNDFSNFLADMGERPPGMSIDRINTYGHYTPSNCRWATRQQQMQNRRT